MNQLCIPEHGSGEQQGVDAVEDAAVAGEQVAGVLDAGRTLESGLGQISDLRGDVDQDGKSQPVPEVFRVREPNLIPLGGKEMRQAQQGAGGQQAACQRAERALPGLVGAERGGHLVASPGAAYVKGGRCSSPYYGE